ncbi:MAG: triose-phosphate isomerase [Candidatus Margulisbacteria bacterium]|nr:triose-phosphate isomerase [Candidatus Margulisiibacteriota bacterium]
MKMRSIIVGNWKMNPTQKEVRPLAEGVAKGLSDQATFHDVVICPPFVFLSAVGEVCHGGTLQLGAQNVCSEPNGAYTGEISTEMLVDAGCEYVIIGHSERRQLMGESNSDVNLKMAACFKYGLCPIVCVGETLSERQDKKTLNVIRKQLQSLSGLKECSSNCIVAYEPIWAIGTGTVATPDQAQEVHHFIRSEWGSITGSHAVKEMRIIYGGSVKPGNIDEIMEMRDIDGVLVGGASLDVSDFLRIIHYKEKVNG